VPAGHRVVDGRLVGSSIVRSDRLANLPAAGLIFLDPTAAAKAPDLATTGKLDRTR